MEAARAVMAAEAAGAGAAVSMSAVVAAAAAVAAASAASAKASVVRGGVASVAGSRLGEDISCWCSDAATAGTAAVPTHELLSWRGRSSSCSC